MERKLNVGEVARAADDAAHQQHAACELVGVCATGGSSYAEVFMRIVRPDGDCRRITLGVFRTVSATELRRDIAGKLQMILARE